jgi:hypothetical protein
MTLQFDRGDPNAPVGHALIYFRRSDGAIVATSTIVSPIAFDMTGMIPPFLKEMTQGVDLGDAMSMVALPPIPQEVPSEEWLRALADRRQDDLVCGGMIGAGDMHSLMAGTADAVRAYADLYGVIQETGSRVESTSPALELDRDRFAGMTQREQLDALSSLTGRLLDATRSGVADLDVERQMRALAAVLPPKYRADELVEAVHQPGDRAQRLAELYIERAYKLYNEDYLDLERLDREIEAAHR